MKKAFLNLRKCLDYSVLLMFICFLGSPSVNGQASIESGKEIFKNQCAACHNRNMKDDLTGPALGGVEERWVDYPQEDLYRWIRNSSAMIAEGHPRAVEIWNNWKPVAMTSFTSLSDEEIESILLYINDQFLNAGVAIALPGAQEVVKRSNNWLYYILFVILAVVAAILARIIANLNYISAKKEQPDIDIEKPTLIGMLTSKGVVGFVIFALIVAMGYTTVTNGIDFGRQQGYAPEQPIKFSHETHAGLHKIDCQYCHDGARRSKHSVIPATNTCMNCHKAIKKGSSYGTQELSKIFASIGFNPNTDNYIDNYDAIPEDSIRAIFSKWIGDEYIKDEGVAGIDKKGERIIKTQWENIKESLTNPLKPKIQGPIEWVRIHHLPDHVYFNHAQHVTVGKLECQECHGKVEEMEVLQQYSPLSMGWCINCHRQTEVQFTSNEYYNAYSDYHEALKSGDKEAVTVEDIGGLECQKCHY
jgi:cytochrome c2